ncbi:U32 family peptidase [Rickettsiales bacterium]|nr:U32 family peptidase [Rickettsiales bacterium]
MTLEIICPAGTPAALRVAIDEGADSVYAGFRDETNARNFPGLNFSRNEMAEGLEYAHAKGKKVFLVVNTFASAGSNDDWKNAVDSAAELGMDAIILADIGLLDYAATNHPDLRIHLSVQASASNPESIEFYRTAFNVKRVVLPRVLTVREIKELNEKINVETEVFAFGGMCTMAEGRCSLSSYITGKSPNNNGVCSPASHVQYKEKGSTLVTELGGFTIDKYEKHEAAGYPTLCKGRFEVNGNEASYLFEDPISLNVSNILPELQDAGVTALKIEGRQRSKAYVRDVVRNFRRAVDACAQGDVANMNVASLCEGQKNTTGAYSKKWQ